MDELVFERGLVPPVLDEGDKHGHGRNERDGVQDQLRADPPLPKRLRSEVVNHGVMRCVSAAISL